MSPSPVPEAKEAKEDGLESNRTMDLRKQIGRIQANKDIDGQEKSKRIQVCLGRWYDYD